LTELVITGIALGGKAKKATAKKAAATGEEAAPKAAEQSEE